MFKNFECIASWCESVSDILYFVYSVLFKLYQPYCGCVFHVRCATQKLVEKKIKIKNWFWKNSFFYLNFRKRKTRIIFVQLFWKIFRDKKIKRKIWENPNNRKEKQKKLSCSRVKFTENFNSFFFVHKKNYYENNNKKI